MSKVSIQPMQWRPVSDISAVAPFSSEDAACFSELRDVLIKHGSLDRFGISLIHRHFDIAPDEEMMEYTDVENRTLVVKPVKLSDIDWENITVTHWRLTAGKKIATVGCVCARGSNGHMGYHRNN